MFKKKKTYVILVIIILAIGGIYYSQAKKPAAQFTIETAKKGDLVETVSVTGTVVSAGQIDLSFKAAGKITAINVKVGDKVKKGQKVAEIDKGTLDSQLAQAKADVVFQKETLNNMKKHKSLFSKDQRDAQSANVDKAQAALSSAMTMIEDTTLLAPKEGIVSKVNYKLGEMTAITTPVITLSGENDLEIEVNIPESDIVKVSLGQKAEVTMDAFSSSDIFNTEVVEIEPASTVIQDVVYYKVKLKFDSPDSRFKNGMSADVDIKTAEKKNIVFVPLRAVKTENGSKYVELLKDEKNGITEKVNVVTGMEGDDGLVEIASGLGGGEKVVTLKK